MKHTSYVSMSLWLLIAHCTMPAADPGPASRVLSASSSPAPVKVVALAEAARPFVRRDSGEDGKRMAESHAVGAAVATAAAEGAAITNVPDKKIKLTATDLIASGQWIGDVFGLAAEN